MRTLSTLLYVVFSAIPLAGSHAATATFSFAPVGQSYLAFLPGDDPLIGRQIVSARIQLDVESLPGSDAANFFTDIAFPIEPLPGNTNALVLVGQELGWSGSGRFQFVEETDRFNGRFISVRYGAETPGLDFDGVILDGSRIEFTVVPEPRALMLLTWAAVGIFAWSRCPCRADALLG